MSSRENTSSIDIPTVNLKSFERSLLNDFQRDFPLSPTPYADIAHRLGVSENEVIESLKTLQKAGAISRDGPVFRPNRVGVSTLAAMEVPHERLLEVAEMVNAYSEVNHNYERDHHFNLWFVATASDETQLQQVLNDIEKESGIEVLYLPLVEDYHIDLGFELKWS